MMTDTKAIAQKIKLKALRNVIPILYCINNEVNNFGEYQ